MSRASSWWRDLALRLAFYVVAGGFVDTMLLLAGTAAPARWLWAPVFGAAVATTAGELLFRLFRFDVRAGWLPASFVAGLSLIAVTTIGPAFAWQWSSQDIFLGLSVLVAAGALLARRLPARAPAIDPSDLVVALIFAIVVGYFARHVAASLPILEQTGTFPFWVDYFYHGGTIASFGDPLALQAGNIALPGAHRFFYHFAPFMPAAALAEITRLPGLGLATAVLSPLGLFVGLCGLYALGIEFGGVALGLIAALLVALLPDASHYGLRNGFYGFQWLVFINPGAPYALGLCAVAWLAALRWFRTQRRAFLWLAALLALLSFLVHVHLFALFVPAAAATGALSFLEPRWRHHVVIAATALGAMATILMVAGFLGHYDAIARPTDFVAASLNNGPHEYLEFFHRLTVDGPLLRTVATVVGGLSIMVAALGIWVLIFPVTAWWEARHGRFRADDYFPVLLCLVYIAQMFWAPVAPNGDVTELHHRQFVLVYAIVLLWTIPRLAVIAGIGAAARSRAWRAVAAGGVIALAAMGLWRDVNPADPSPIMTWTRSFYFLPIPPGIPQTAAFLRAHARPGDIMAVPVAEAHDQLFGIPNELISLSGLPVYVARIDYNSTIHGPQIAALTERRATAVAAIDNAGDRTQALAALRALGIRWYVAVAPDMPAWDRSGGAAIFHDGATFVYDSGVNRSNPTP